MIEETIIVSDSNIIFDLFSVNLLDDFLKLPCKITTTDFVINEIERSEQQTEIQQLIKSKKLYVKDFDIEEINEIRSIFVNKENNVSLTDCSVWYYAKKTKGRLLTGDGKLRKSAENDNVKVSGILYIFDNLIEYNILPKNICGEKLKTLMSLNMRLPKNECEKRILEWI